MGNEVEFLTADKHKSFLQDDSITLGVPTQTVPKYQKQYLKENMKGEVGFFKLILLFLVFVAGHPKLPKITSLVFLYSMLMSDTFDFLHASRSK